MLTRISPALAVAYWVMIHSALLGDQMPMRSPGLQAEGDEAGGEGLDVGGEFGPGPVDTLLADDQAGAVAEAGDGAVEMDPDGIPDHRLAGGAVHVAGRGVGHWCAPLRGLVVRAP